MNSESESENQKPVLSLQKEYNKIVAAVEWCNSKSKSKYIQIVKSR